MTEVRGMGPRVLLLPGLGARGAGFRRLAERLAPQCRPILVEYPTGRAAAAGAATLAGQVFAAAGEVDAVVASSFGGMVAAALAHRGATRGIAFISSFTHLDQLGVRGPAIRLLGPVAVFGRPGPGAAAIAAHQFVPGNLIADIVPSTPEEREAVMHRAFAIPREPPPPPLRAEVRCIALHGDRDWLLPLEVLPRLVAALPAGTPSHVIVGAGHVPYFTHATVVSRILLPWLASLGARVQKSAA